MVTNPLPTQEAMCELVNNNLRLYQITPQINHPTVCHIYPRIYDNFSTIIYVSYHTA